MSNPNVSDYKVTNKVQRSGIYKFVDGELMEAEHTPRVQAGHTNWDAGNADPEDIQRHKELLDRQYFGGPVWENTGRPMKAEDDIDNVLKAYEDVEGETHPGAITKDQMEQEGDEEELKVSTYKSVKR